MQMTPAAPKEIYWDLQGLHNEIRSGDGNLLLYSKKVEIIFQSRNENVMRDIIEPDEQVIKISTNH